MSELDEYNLNALSLLGSEYSMMATLATRVIPAFIDDLRKRKMRRLWEIWGQTGRSPITR